MQAILFIGIQATGKSTFYKQNFFNSHVRISLDLLNTKNKQQKFLETCFETNTQFVVDNTNVEKERRKYFIDLAKENKYKVIGYYFKSNIQEALERNSLRKGKEKIPNVGLFSTRKKLELPNYEEGFDALYFVEIIENEFVITEWKNEI
ncbi:AAA family ATPase [Aureivirga sp. CE67]|uniref:AAA family ATPase n=1 Tax=Aureivirga sp. CE67 TaxID=1788983 RepID=UPI0018CA4C9B|nr:AAA family ATPase [Aureivirga sp. CE67]